MRSNLLGILILVLMLISSDLPGWFEAAAPVPAAARADRDDEPEDDHDEDGNDDGGDADGRSGYTGGGARGGNIPLRSGASWNSGSALTRGPYLQLGTSTGITIRWRTRDLGPSLVRYGSAPDNLEFQKEDPTPIAEHEVRLSNLAPDTRYYYSIGTASTMLAGGPECSFRTAPPVGSERPTRIWLIGDSGQRGQAQQRVEGAYDGYSRGTETDVWLLLGDNAYSTGTSQQYEAGFFEPYRKRLRSTVVWPSRGNHDETRQGPGNDYYDFFTLPTAGEAGGIPSRTETYYSFDFANVHFVCLDAERLQSAMIDWLRADLAATKQDWVIAYWHHPPYSRGSHDSDTDGIMSQARRRFLPVLEQGGVDLVACGHSHSYERSFLLDGHYGNSGSLERSMILDRGDGRPDGDGPYRKPTYGRPTPHEGTVYVVVGSSAKLSGGSLNHRAHARSLNVLGSLAIDVLGKRLDAAFVDDRGRVADRFTIVKGEGPTSSRMGRPSVRGGTAAGRALPENPPAGQAGDPGVRVEPGSKR